MKAELFDLKGKKAVVIGGGGIGLACAKAMGAYGAEILLCDRNAQYAAQGLQELLSEGIAAQSATVDISCPESVDTLMQEIGLFGGVDVFLNAAAVTNRKPVLEMTFEEWRRVIDVNLNGAYLIGRAIGQYMVDQGRGGSMIYIVSTGAYRANINFGAYSASKAGVVMLAKTLALELAPQGIRVNAIAPTVTETRFLDGLYDEHPEKREQAIRNHPLGRIATPEDYMGAAVYLASGASAFVTGELLIVDGGKTAK